RRLGGHRRSRAWRADARGPTRRRRSRRAGRRDDRRALRPLDRGDDHPPAGVGIDVSSLTIVASVLGVGVGFGLQNIANNFGSGFLLTLERPIKPGDFVQIGELMGTVERIGARSTEVWTLDRVSIIVPNAHLLEKEVVNWSHGDPVSRIHVPVSIEYGADLRRARAAMLEAARTHRDVLRDPRPAVE